MLGIVYDDEMSSRRAGRNVEDERTGTSKSFDGTKIIESVAGAYDEYAVLWARYMRLSMEVVKRNQYITVVNTTDKSEIITPMRDVIPRIQYQIDQGSIDADNLKKLTEYQTHHIAMWKEMESVIDELCKNAYIARRTHNSVEQLFQYRRGLYDQIRN